MCREIGPKPVGLVKQAPDSTTKEIGDRIPGTHFAFPAFNNIWRGGE